MGLRFRKSVNLGGGFRINVSKSGIGYSWGLPGYRVSSSANGRKRTTVSVPGTGFSHISESGGKNKKNNFSGEEIFHDEEMKEIESGEIKNFKNIEHKELIKSIEKNIGYNTLSNLLLWLVLLTPAYPWTIIFPILGIILKILLRTKLKINIEYEFNDGMLEVFNDRAKNWKIINESFKKWQVTNEMKVSRTKVNAGAGRNVKLIPLKITDETFSFIETNIKPVVFKLKKEELIIFPDKILIIKNKKVGAINYDKLEILITDTNFIEEGSVPRDSEVIGKTWQYVNKNGQPDKRFKDNKLLPICRYGVIKIKSPEGLNIELMLSSHKVSNKIKSNLL